MDKSRNTYFQPKRELEDRDADSHDAGMKPAPLEHIRRLTFTASRTVVCESFALPSPGPKQVLVRARSTLMSTGTETIVYARKFDPGTHWDNWVKYPFHPGYALVGQVVAIGSEVTSLAAGDWVVSRTAHASHIVVDAGHCFRIPTGVDVRDASWFALAKIAAMGAHAAPMALGDRTLIIGAGPIGQMSLRWAVAAGAQSVAVLDPQGWRLPMATAGGATHVIGQPVAEAAAAVRAIFGEAGPNLVIDATGHHDVLPHALGLCGYQGTVLVIGDTGRPALQHLTPDLLTRGLRIVGAHDCNETASWNSQRIIPLFFSLIAGGRFNLSGLITHTFTPEQCSDAYELADTGRGKTMGICFDWSAS